MEIDEFHHIHEKMKKFVNLRISGSSMISKNEIEIFGNILVFKRLLGSDGMRSETSFVTFSFLLLKNVLASRLT